ncbi:uncharacterized protein [Eucyclogobius newberryi]|uniref:uncharacterized protein n=1 Tax=Eucyclogobius newberryi TaxID=166745 RepID=UPI003B59DFEE
MAAAARGAHGASVQRWFFSREQLQQTPSRCCGVEPDRELSYRQQAANLIQDMGQRLNVSQLTINTAIVYMHRFYMQHSFTKFHRNTMSPTTLFLAAKVEEQPRKLEHVIKVCHACLNPSEPPLDPKSNAYLQQAQELVVLESMVLQTLGFEVTIDHPHTDVVKCTQLVRASKDLAQTSYFMATNSLHLTTFCLQHRPTVIACVCIHLACKWSNWEIPVSTDGKHWWEYVDQTVTIQLLDELTHQFLQILEKTPSRLKRIRNWRATQAAKKPRSDGSFPPDAAPPRASLLLLHQPNAPPLTSSSVPLTSSSVPLTSSSVPLTSSSVPLTSSSVPLTSSSVPLTSSSVPLTSSSVPLTSSSVPSTSSDWHQSLRPEPNVSAKDASNHQQITANKLSLERYREKKSETQRGGGEGRGGESRETEGRGEKKEKEAVVKREKRRHLQKFRRASVQREELKLDAHSSDEGGRSVLDLRMAPLSPLDDSGDAEEETGGGERNRNETTPNHLPSTSCKSAKVFRSTHSPGGGLRVAHLFSPSDSPRDVGEHRH